MIDAQAVGETLANPAHDLGVRFVEHLGHLDADAGEGVHREEAAVVEVVVGAGPVHELVALPSVHLLTGSSPSSRGARCYGIAVVVVAQFELDVVG